MEAGEEVTDNAHSIIKIVEILEVALAQLDNLQLHIAGAHVSYAIEFLTKKSDSKN